MSASPVVTILGAGRVGRALAEKLEKAGRTVILGSRRGPIDPARACRDGDIVINALPGAVSVASLVPLEDVLRGKVLVDVANASTRGPDGMPNGLVYPGGSLGEELQRALPETRVVKTLNTMVYTVMTEPTALSMPVSAFLSGDDAPAKELVGALLVDLGWPREWILDLGGIASARAPEAFVAMLGAVAATFAGSGLPRFGLAIAR
ncbi:NADP oxidoreductase [Pendulispora rubella]|uniref:NADP oxidoreductase n=1 Tax=Pendulispora rubella TaxID=2741070 RepID=A0ABZ2KRS4_9BACT